MQKFPKVTKAEWLAKVEKDLKGKPLAGLDFEVEGQPVTPFWNGEDLPARPDAISNKPGWRIGQVFEFRGVEETNKDILKALNRGVNAIYIQKAGNSLLKPDLIDGILKDVLLDLVEVYYDEDGIPRDKDCEHSFGAPFHELKDAVVVSGHDLFLGYLRFKNPDFKSEGSFTPVFHFLISDDFYSSIAHLRAMRLCWKRLCEVVGEKKECRLVAHVYLNDVKDEHTNKIAATSRTISAVLGGADTIFAYPSDGVDGTDFTNRIAVNVHHLLQYESHFDQVADPVAGSYFLENLTDRFAEIIWTSFQNDEHDRFPFN